MNDSYHKLHYFYLCLRMHENTYNNNDKILNFIYSTCYMRKCEIGQHQFEIFEVQNTR